MDMTAEYPVLVYGTLRPSGSNYGYFLEGSTDAETNVQLDGFIMYGESGCPFLDYGDRTITATLISITPSLYAETMEGLDGLEGFRGENDPQNSYERVLHTFTVEGVQIQAWVYVMSASLRKYIIGSTAVLESGDWISHVAEQEKLYAW